MDLGLGSGSIASLPLKGIVSRHLIFWGLPSFFAKSLGTHVFSLSLIVSDHNPNIYKSQI